MLRYAETRRGRLHIIMRAADDASQMYVHPVPSNTRALGNVFSINDGPRRPSVQRTDTAPVFELAVSVRTQSRAHSIAGR
jgi:hypothetical protein